MGLSGEGENCSVGIMSDVDGPGKGKQGEVVDPNIQTKFMVIFGVLAFLPIVLFFIFGVTVTKDEEPGVAGTNGVQGESFFTAEAEYEAGGERGTYVMRVQIREVTVQGGEEKEAIVAAPVLTGKIGEEARMEMLGEKGGRDIIVSSFYPARESHAPIVCSVEIKENGQTIYRTKVRVQVKELSSKLTNSEELIDVAVAKLEWGDPEGAQTILMAVVLAEPANRRAKYYLENCKRTIERRAEPEVRERIFFP